MGFTNAIPADGAVDVALDVIIRAAALPPPFPSPGDSITYSITSPGSQTSGALIYPAGWVYNESTFLWGTWDAPTLVGNTTYTWSFTTNFGESGGPFTFTTITVPVLPNKPTNPAPTDAASDIALGTDQVSWEDGGGADTFDVYFGPTGNMTLRSSGQAGTTWDIPLEVLFYDSGYQWRIDATNAQGTTTGDTWTFDTLVFAPPVPSGEAPGAGGEHGGEGGLNNMVTVKRLVAAANNTIFYEDE